MAYRLKQTEPVVEGLYRIAREQASKAAEIGVEKVAGDAEEESVHEARTRCKKLRGLLRLVRPHLGEVYRYENDFLRDAARRLSEARDTAVIERTFDDVVFKSGLNGDDIAHLRRAILGPGHASPSDAVHVKLGAFRQSMSAFLNRIAEWPIVGEEYEVVEPGLVDTYRRGHQAMKLARKTGTDEDWHQWRKRAKDHWYHVRLIRNVWKPVLKAREGELAALSDLLGEDHNLAVLDAKLRDLPDVDEFLRQPLHQRIEQRRERLKSAAIPLGACVYAESPKAFRKRIKRYWQAWRG